MPYFNEAQREQWRTDNADLVEFIQTPAHQRASRFISSMFQAFTNYGNLTEAQTRAARNVMRELLNDTTGATTVDDPNQPALADDAVHLPNGTFTINDGTEHLTYKIHTVRNGSLRGKRIIKRQLAYGEFKGFAFLTRQGTVKVWRSFYEDEAANERYIVWARLLLAALNERFSDGYSGTEDSFEFTYAEGSGYQIQASVYCRRCNRALTDPTSISLGIGPECRNLEQTARTTAAAPHEPLDIGTYADSIRISETTITADHIAHSSIVSDQADQVIDITPAQVAELDDTEVRMIALIEQARETVRRRSVYGISACDYCGRSDFQSNQGRGRHVSLCRRSHNDTLVNTRLARLRTYREENGLDRNDEYSRLGALRQRLGRSVTMARPARRVPSFATTSVGSAAPVTPNLSALGTVFNGQVWEQ